jgi:hypothetical protein
VEKHVGWHVTILRLGRVIICSGRSFKFQLRRIVLCALGSDFDLKELKMLREA